MHFFRFSSISASPKQADQICYSVLCVFSYVAAGQEQKKNFNPSKALPPQQQQQSTQSSVHQSASPQTRPSALTSSPMPSKQSHPQEKTPTQSVVIPVQKPAVTVAAVQPQPSATKSTTAGQSTPNMQSRPSVTDETKTNLPQLPPRVQSQASVPSRGPPPAIPPRNNLPTRSTSIQVTSVGPNRPALTRQTSANMIPPQFTPQPPPKFVIPQRQPSRTSMGRSGSVSGPSEIGSPPSSSPQMQRHAH